MLMACIVSLMVLTGGGIGERSVLHVIYDSLLNLFFPFDSSILAHWPFQVGTLSSNTSTLVLFRSLFVNSKYYCILSFV
jgi:hypothetical protein